ncbi:ABC-type multidrug transport system, ATPase component [Salinarchaeum sp. Harcht-Bsk1]|uniref:ABC transporter ATP-binding protein n=1 Tax=Salinarchaeum sp. Harcht-Bsk1 TaxID=1333523 RepID=UPI0003423326|nr:ABC transporter ATP-binding protein [Salinarchaeum sp. Harcht-Bsk1]AGN02962.1 ABC-type multidrug transport system, ATPase component [Salinarchaeum sp. Harcht-Bsk1]
MCPVLAAEDVRKTYGETIALDGVSLAAEEGAVVALVGPNGAGKTTLVRSLTGTITPDSGTIRVLGTVPEDVDRNPLGVLPQSFEPPGRLSAIELLRYYAGLYDDARDPHEVLETVGVADAANTRYENLSGGQQRRVCLGAALVNDPAVLILDEPTTGIDPEGRRTVRDQIASLADGGATILVTTHDMDEAERIADRVVLLADGRVSATGSPSELIEEHGGAPRVIVEFADEASIDAAVAALERDGLDVERERDRVVVRDVRPESIESVVEVLGSAGVDYEGLEWRRPALEDAYLAVAGEASRIAATATAGQQSSPTVGGDRR